MTSSLAPAAVTARFETDIADEAIQALIDQAEEEIVDRFGRYRADGPITETVRGRRRRLNILRPIDTSQPVTVVEWITADPEDVLFADELDDSFIDIGQEQLNLAADDFRVENRGRTIERLYTGTNPRVLWGSRADITYQPIDDTARRNEVTLKLVILSLQYQGVIDQKIGDTQTTYGQRSASQPGQALIAYTPEREALLQSLAPRRGLLIL